MNTVHPYLHGPSVGIVVVTLDKVMAAELIVDAGEVGVGLDGDGLVPGELGQLCVHSGGLRELTITAQRVQQLGQGFQLHKYITWLPLQYTFIRFERFSLKILRDFL